MRSSHFGRSTCASDSSGPLMSQSKRIASGTFRAKESAASLFISLNSRHRNHDSSKHRENYNQIGLKYANDAPWRVSLFLESNHNYCSSAKVIAGSCKIRW